MEVCQPFLKSDIKSQPQNSSCQKAKELPEHYLKEEKVKLVAETLIMLVLKYGLKFCGRDYFNLVRLQRLVQRLMTRSSMMSLVRLMLVSTSP